MTKKKESKPIAAEPEVESAPADYPKAMHKGTGDDYRHVIVRSKTEEDRAATRGFTFDVPLTDDQTAAVAQARADAGE